MVDFSLYGGASMKKIGSGIGFWSKLSLLLALAQLVMAVYKEFQTAKNKNK
ncbi:hypothetical protein FC80_GL000293 [Liquorilactobacillus cacaonum DSM 21116]|uniref:Uncharacterized protein n=1 Tax=Liquorilactobacillus cacaonum DSM 21116 TaxID=1423729 RepID=A0A0R2CKG0_9LACO|nr:hypothetical protein FC80_GL000293 [Liquorilactobacillus cacaonum DSM 21116]